MLSKIKNLIAKYYYKKFHHQFLETLMYDSALEAQYNILKTTHLPSLSCLEVEAINIDTGRRQVLLASKSDIYKRAEYYTNKVIKYGTGNQYSEELTRMTQWLSCPNNQYDILNAVPERGLV